VLVGSALEHPIEDFWALDTKKMWNAPVMRRFAEGVTHMAAMSELELEIYAEESLHIDVFDEEQWATFMETDDLDVLREISQRNIDRHMQRHGNGH
jgi:hypothetical protein